MPNITASTGGSVVEFSPATREARVRFPASAGSNKSFYYVFHEFLDHKLRKLTQPKYISKKFREQQSVSKQRNNSFYSYLLVFLTLYVTLT